MKPPAGAELPNGKVYKIVKGLYGLKQSGRVWSQELDKLLRQLGFMPLSPAPCVYMRGTGQTAVILITYVDDIAMTSPDLTTLSDVKSALLAKYKMEDKGPIDSFCGIRVTYDMKSRTLRMTQQAYIDTVITEFLPQGGTAKVPMDATPSPDRPDSTLISKYQRLVGKLMWLSNHTRPDLSYSVGVLARHMSQPTPSAMNAAIRVVKYLNNSADVALNYQPSDTIDLVGFTDANWASDPNSNRKSTSGSAVFLAGCLISWRTQLQRCVALSAVEAELVASSEAARELLFVRNLLQAMGVTITPRLFTDSLGCVQVSKDPAQHWKLKHIDTRYHFLRDHVQSDDLLIEHTRSEVNLADMFTKPVGHHVLYKHRPQLGLTHSQHQTTPSAKD